jgi:hypothetical protein
MLRLESCSEYFLRGYNCFWVWLLMLNNRPARAAEKVKNVKDARLLNDPAKDDVSQNGTSNNIGEEDVVISARKIPRRLMGTLRHSLICSSKTCTLTLDP